MSTIILHSRTSSFAREIRNPLCVITLACDMLDTITFDIEQRKYVDMVTRAAGRISREVTAFLAEDTRN